MAIKDSLGYALVQAAKRHRGLMGSALGALDLHVGQELLLLEVWGADGLSQAELADRLGIEAPTVAKAVRRMEVAGLVRRERDTRDARVQRVHLTDRGGALRASVERCWAEVEEQLFGDLTAEERRQLHGLVSRARAPEHPADVSPVR